MWESKLVSSSSLSNNADEYRTGPFFGKIGVAFTTLFNMSKLAAIVSAISLGRISHSQLARFSLVH